MNIQEAFITVPGVTLVNYSQAPHSGYHHITFKADTDTLEKLAKVLLHDAPWLNCNISVHYDNGITYCIHKGHIHVHLMISCLLSLNPANNLDTKSYCEGYQRAWHGKEEDCPYTDEYLKNSWLRGYNGK